MYNAFDFRVAVTTNIFFCVKNNPLYEGVNNDDVSPRIRYGKLLSLTLICQRRFTNAIKVLSVGPSA